MLTERCRNIVIAVAGVIVVVCDALRDKWVVRTVEWWQWHLVKWVAFYAPLVIIFLLIKRKRKDWLWVAGYAMGCWLLWRLVYWY